MIRLIWSPFSKIEIRKTATVEGGNSFLQAPNKLAGKLPIRLGGLVHVAHSGQRFRLRSTAAKLLDDSRPPRIRNLSFKLGRREQMCPGQSALVRL
jgi:hypothetical protein